MLEKGYTIVLENNQKYTIIENINYDNVLYYYLVNDNKDVIFGKVINNELIIVNNNEIINKLFSMVNAKLNDNKK